MPDPATPPPDAAPVGASDDRLAAIEAELVELQRRSRERQAELKAIAAELPAVTSRRTVIKELAASVRHAPDKPTVIRRTGAKVLRLPADAVRRLRS